MSETVIYVRDLLAAAPPLGSPTGKLQPVLASSRKLSTIGEPRKNGGRPSVSSDHPKSLRPRWRCSKRQAR